MATISSLPFAVAVAPQPVLAASFTLTSAVGGANLPFTLGHAFKKGEVSSTASVVGSIPELQVTVKNRWPDGSLKFAIISGRATLAAATAQKISLSTGTPAAGTALTTTDLRATGVTATLDASPFGSVSWTGADWTSPFMTWVSGPVMSSWIYRKQVGTDAHLVAWLEVRLYKGGQVEVLPWIENGYLKVASPTNKSGNFVFTLGGTQRFNAPIDLPNHCRTVLISGVSSSYWHGADPQITPKHDTAYMQGTKLVPAYHATVPSTAKALSGLAQAYSPLTRANYPLSMGSAGFDPSIGLLPEWDVLYLTSQDARAYAGVIVNAYSAGRYGIHFRDETTQRPIRFSSHPNLLIDDSSSVTGIGSSKLGQYTPKATGTGPAKWVSTHHPSVGFTAYLVTGRFYFMEEAQFSATIHYLKSQDNYRLFSQGVLQTQAGGHTVRGAAWALRTLAQAACITPDNDLPLRTEMLASLEANVNYYHSKYVQSSPNPFGLVAPYVNYTSDSGRYSSAPWQQDFFTASMGYALAMEPALPSGLTKLKAFFTWTARSVIGRLGRAGLTSDWSYRDAGIYYMPYSPLPGVPDWFNPATYYSSWGEMYQAGLAKANTEPPGDLRGSYFPDPNSYWGNLQPAIAYAVQHKVPGALEAYNRMTSAPNWSLIMANFNKMPVWSVRP